MQADNIAMDRTTNDGYQQLVNRGVLKVGPRPSLQQTVTGLFEKHARGTVAVGVCGPQAMVDDVHIHAQLLEAQFKGSRVNIHTETFDF